MKKLSKSCAQHKKYKNLNVKKVLCFAQKNTDVMQNILVIHRGYMGRWQSLALTI